MTVLSAASLLRFGGLAQAARAAGVDESTFTKWSRGSRVPNAAGRAALERLFKFRWSDLLSEATIEIRPAEMSRGSAAKTSTNTKTLEAIA